MNTPTKRLVRSLFSQHVRPLMRIDVPLVFKPYEELHFSIAATNYDILDVITGAPQPRVESVEFNTAFLPFMDEDEILYILLHEAAHVNAGWHAHHGPKWARECAKIGVPAHELVFVRRMNEVSSALGIPWSDEYANPTFPTQWSPNW